MLLCHIIMTKRYQVAEWIAVFIYECRNSTNNGVLFFLLALRAHFALRARLKRNKDKACSVGLLSIFYNGCALSRASLQGLCVV